MTIKRDLVCQGHVTLSVTFTNSGTSDAREIIFFFVSQVFGVADVK